MEITLQEIVFYVVAAAIAVFSVLAVTTGKILRAMEQKNSYEKIYDIVKQIPRGTVATYGQVAALAGNKRWARVVGYALHVNPDPEGIPCYRVVNREGRVSEAFAFGGENRQIGLLEADGIEVKDGCVDLSKYQWRKEIF